MCRELNREPAWVAAIKLALTRGRVDVDAVAAEANLVPGRERTIRDVLETMADRDLLVATDDGDAYLVGPVLRRSAPSPSAVANISDSAVHQWDGDATSVRG